MLAAARGGEVTREVFPGIVVNPDFQFGEPCIAAYWLTCASLVSRFRGGDSVIALAEDYRIPTASVEAAIRWALLSPGTRRKRLITAQEK